MHRTAVLLVCVLAMSLAGCAAQPVSPPTADPARLVTCRTAFVAWVDAVVALSAPDVRILEATMRQNRVQRRVFELCSLDEAERLNREPLLQPVPGLEGPLIPGGILSFARTECLSEGPLLEGTRLCEEVGR